MKKYRLDTLKCLDNISTYNHNYYEAPDGTMFYELADDDRYWPNEWYVVGEDNGLTFIGFTEESDIEIEWKKRKG